MLGLNRKKDNAWLAADRRERWKNVATVVILGGAVIGGLVALALSAFAG